jgi:hypothetical protein
MYSNLKFGAIATFTSLYPEAVKMVLNYWPFFLPITALIR